MTGARLFNKFKDGKSIFIETGTNMGNGVQNALTSGFNRVISIEKSSSKFNFCRGRFRNNPRVELYYGCSAALLFTILMKINEPVVFWLDAHLISQRPLVSINLLKELEVIHNYQIKGHTILIDDVDLLTDTGSIDAIVSCINSDYKSEYCTLTARRPNQVKVWSIK